MSEKRDLHYELMRLEVAPTFQKIPKSGIKRQLYELYIEVINRAIEAENEIFKLQQENAKLLARAVEAEKWFGILFDRKTNSVSVDSFCELVADKIAQRIKGE